MKGIIFVILLGFLVSTEAGLWMSLPAANSSDPQCGSWTKTSYFWDSEDSSNANAFTGTTPLGEYGKDIRMYFCTGYVDEVPPGKYCFFQNSRNSANCPTGFTEGRRTQDEENGTNLSRREGNEADMPRITNLGDYPTWFMCCSSSTASYTSQFWAKQRSQLPPQFVLMREGGTCQPMLDRTVQTGSVFWDDEDDATTNCGLFGCSNNRNSASGNLPDGTYDSNTKIEYCTYSVSTGPYPATAIDITNRTQNSVSLTWNGAKNADYYNVVVKNGNTVVLNTNVNQASILISSLSPLTTYSVQIFSGKTLSSVQSFEVVGITQQISTCATGYFGVSCSTAICNPSCVSGTCTSPNFCTCSLGYGGATCNQCDSGYYPSNGKCVSCPNCGNGFCSDGPLGTGSCTCYAGYKTPINTTNYCSACLDSYFSSNGACLPCDNTCLTCSQAGTCLTCVPGFVLDSLTSKCNSNCTGVTYYDGISCKPCHSSCGQCNGGGSNNCLSCNSTSDYLDGSTCVSQCPIGKFTNSNKICRDCVYPCQSCSGLSINSCLTCQTGYYLNGTNYCLTNTECTANGGYASGSSCTDCHSSCNTCTGPSSSECLSCTSDKVFFSGKCLSNCPDGYILNPVNKQCQACTPPCSTCFSLSQNDCLSCQDPRKLYNSNCVTGCPVNYYLNTTLNECKQCSPDCLTCQDNADYCLTCSDENNLNYLGKCVSSCPVGFYPSGIRCRPCIDDCKTCDGVLRQNAVPGSYCLSCKNDSFILFDGRCLETCPVGHKFENNTCEYIPTAAPTPNATAAPTTPPTPSPTAENSENKKRDVAIGVGVGVSLCIVLVLLALGFLFMRRRTDRKFTFNESQIHMSTMDNLDQRQTQFIARKVSISAGPSMGDEDQATLMNTQLNVALPGFLLIDFYKQLREEGPLGSGGVGVLYHGVILDQTLVQKHETDQVVIKHLTPIASLNEEKNKTLFNNEVSISWALSYHPNIAKLIGYCEDPRVIVLKLYEKDLLAFLKEPTEKLSVKRILHLAGDICKGINAIHKFNAAHRDVKSKNVLIERGLTEDDTDIRAVICDFGLAMVYEEQMVDRKGVNLNGLSPKYAAPEIFSDARMPQPSLSVEDYKKADVFAYGVVLWELVTRQVPWSGQTTEQVELAIRSGERLRFPELEDPSLTVLCEIAKKCWDADPTRRPTIPMIATQFD